MRRLRSVVILTAIVLTASMCADGDSSVGVDSEPTGVIDDAVEHSDKIDAEDVQSLSGSSAVGPVGEPDDTRIIHGGGLGYSAAFILIGHVDDGGWNATHLRAIDEVRAAFPGLEIQVIEIPYSPRDVTDALENLATDGVDILIVTSYFMDETLEVAKNHPDAVFLNYAGYITAPNVGHFAGATEDGRYLDGLVAGSLTETDIIGYLASETTYEVNRGLNAFAIGVHEVNADAIVRAIFTGSWYDSGAELQAAETLVGEGADVLAHHFDSSTVASVAEALGTRVIGYSSNRSDVAPTAWASSFTFEWGAYYIGQLQAVMDGTWKPSVTYGGLADGLIGNAPYGPDVSDEILALVEERRNEVANGTRDYFAGPLWDNEGRVVVDEGNTISVETRSYCCLFLLRGIEVTIPGV